jgi:hypothetical protein
MKYAISLVLGIYAAWLLLNRYHENKMLKIRFSSRCKVLDLMKKNPKKAWDFCQGSISPDEFLYHRCKFNYLQSIIEEQERQRLAKMEKARGFSRSDGAEEIEWFDIEKPIEEAKPLPYPIEIGENGYFLVPKNEIGEGHEGSK